MRGNRRAAHDAAVGVCGWRHRGPILLSEQRQRAALPGKTSLRSLVMRARAHTRLYKHAADIGIHAHIEHPDRVAPLFGPTVRNEAGGPAEQAARETGYFIVVVAGTELQRGKRAVACPEQPRR